MEKYEDIDIVEQILKGNKNLYRIIVKKYQNPIFSFMLRFTRSQRTSEELTQEAFMKAYKALNRFNPEKKFFPWLYTIALNIARDWKRKTRTSIQNPMPFSEDKYVADIENQELLITRTEDIKLVQEGLNALSLDYREALILRFKYELSFREISQVFDISLSAAKMRIHRGIKKLKQMIYHEKK